MDQSQSKPGTDNQNPQKLFCKQPITCPWITAQPYQSTLNKNRSCDSTTNKTLPTIPLSVESRTFNEKSCPSLQHSSSQFFYFLRLMQLFPETHPATLHTVLCLCKNDFFCAVDKLLYAKRCKAMYSRSQGIFKRCSGGRSHPYCGVYGGVGKMTSQAKSTETVVNASVADCGKSSEAVDVGNNLEVVEDNDITSQPRDDSFVPTDVSASTTEAVVLVEGKDNSSESEHVVSMNDSILTEQIQCDNDKTSEA